MVVYSDMPWLVPLITHGNVEVQIATINAVSNTVNKANEQVQELKHLFPDLLSQSKKDINKG